MTSFRVTLKHSLYGNIRLEFKKQKVKIMIKDVNNMSIKAISQLLSESSIDDAILDLLKQDQRKGVQSLVLKYEKNILKAKLEDERLEKMWLYEKECYKEGYHAVAGTDEVGRGCLAGPVVAAAVILPNNFILKGINDSKKLTARKREEFSLIIKEQALAFSIQEISPEVIDQINILHAAELAMENAISNLQTVDYILVDGENNLNIALPFKNIIQGDSKSISIAAASILAKVHRDQLLEAYDQVYPEYGFASHKGYGTSVHYEALKMHGPSPLHRRSFRLI